ncbi:outer membrane lipoprotein-sorting protein [Oligoflexus tunisiensis]|uniref:outer membrane lipoprotein-sorting protein n=1 Tax=Oligoflexus tunisiensis TaxID=708132 RepID=UPI00114C8EE8|nr:outer membrane lipoprotein-sorting protein [Oligoflexus tunisiensis]
MLQKVLLLLSCFAALQVQAGPSPAEILKRADEVRNPSQSFTMVVTVKDHDGTLSKFEVKTKGKDRTLVKTIEAPHTKSNALLMVEQDMWAYIPNLKRAVRVSLQQKLTGQAANGDIARMRLSGDYEAVLEKENKDLWQLFLTANKKGLTYDKIRLWVSKDGFRPRKAEYLTMAGNPLKVASFESYTMMAGAQRPKNIRIQDAKRSSQYSVLEIISLKNGEFPDAMFQASNLGP